MNCSWFACRVPPKPDTVPVKAVGLFCESSIASTPPLALARKTTLALPPEWTSDGAAADLDDAAVDDRAADDLHHAADAAGEHGAAGIDQRPADYHRAVARGFTMAPALIVPPLTVKFALSSAPTTSDLAAILAPTIALSLLKPSVTIMALAPEVRSVPPLIVELSRMTSAALPLTR